MRLYEIEEFDPSYYMDEGCGIFALALAQVAGSGRIGILSDPDGEKWSSSLPYEVTHVVFVDDKGQLWDATGKTTKNELENYFNTTLKPNGGFSPLEFKNRFVGDDDHYPLYGSDDDIKEAITIIDSNKLFQELK